MSPVPCGRALIRDVADNPAHDTPSAAIGPIAFDLATPLAGPGRHRHPQPDGMRWQRAHLRLDVRAASANCLCGRRLAWRVGEPSRVARCKRVASGVARRNANRISRWISCRKRVAGPITGRKRLDRPGLDRPGLDRPWVSGRNRIYRHHDRAGGDCRPAHPPGRAAGHPADRQAGRDHHLQGHQHSRLGSQLLHRPCRAAGG